MDIQPYLEYDPSKVAELQFAAPLLPTKEYSTFVTNFPGMNCFEPYGTSGNFFLSFTFYRGGKKVGELHSNHVDEKGCIQSFFDEFTDFFPESFDGLVITHYHFALNVPPELYVSAVHKKTGAYVAFPASAYMGDTIYIEGHARHLENTMFWPGIVANEHSQESVIILNPYDVPFSYQVSLFLKDRKREQTPIKKIRPFSSQTFSIDELFPNYRDEILASDGMCSLCVAAQYKVVALIMFKNRETGIITTIDHPHSYGMY